MKTVLITGATGAIGSALVPYFLAEKDTKIRLLLRADSEAHLQERLDAMWRFWNVDHDTPELRRRVQAVMGDVCQPRLGLQGRAYAELAGEVTHIVHAAGNVKLNQTLGDARRHAVDAVRHIVALAQEAQRRGHFQKLDAVSTVGVAGRRRGLIAEAPTTAVPGYHNTYEEAKAEAETFLLRAIDQELPVTIHRPSMVVGDSRDGKIIHFQVFYHLSEFLSGRRTSGIVPDTGGVRLDIVPVDYVARAIHAASARPESIGRILHLCSGPQESLLISALADRLRDLLADRGIRLPKLRRIDRRWFSLGLPAAIRLAPPALKRALKGLPFFLAYLEEEQSFDNRLSRAFLEPLGIALPSPEEFLPRIMEYFWSKPNPD